MVTILRWKTKQVFVSPASGANARCVLALHPGWAATKPGGRVPVAERLAGMRGVIHRADRHDTGSLIR